MAALINKRILIVEDSGLVGGMVADMMSELGALPIGPALTEREAMDMIDKDPDKPDVAILDLGLDRSSVDVAARLHELGVPFIFATGMPDEIPARYSHVPFCAKPYTAADLLDALDRVFETPKVIVVDERDPFLSVGQQEGKLMIVASTRVPPIARH